MALVDGWTARGRPIPDPAVRRELAQVVEQASALLPGRGTLRTPRSAEAADVLVDELLDEALRLPVRATGRDELLVALARLDGRLAALDAHRLHEALLATTRSLARLRSIPTADQLLDRAPAEIANGLGFDRVFISRVEDSWWIPVKFYVEGDEALAEELLAASTQQPQRLDHMILESEMARRREPMLVLDVQGNPQVHRPIAEVSDSRSYVAAPIMPEGRVIGFVHADFYVSRRHPDEVDRDILFAFAQAFGHVFERVVLAGRLRAQGDQARAMAASLEAVLGEIRDSEVRIAGEADVVPGESPRLAPPAAGDDRLAALMTARELEVLALLATGLTNGGIAERLVISEGTVKSHVKHILRKLRASNRAEAVSKYLRLSGG